MTTATVKQPANSQENHDDHGQQSEAISRLREATAYAMKQKTAADLDRAKAAAVRLVRQYSSQGKTAAETAEAARFIIWCSLGCLLETPELSDLLERLKSEAITAAVMA